MARHVLEKYILPDTITPNGKRYFLIHKCRQCNTYATGTITYDPDNDFPDIPRISWKDIGESVFMMTKNCKGV